MIFIAKQSKIFLFVSLVLGLFFFSQIPKVRNIEDVDHFIIKDDPDNLYYEEFKEIFGSDEFFLICFEKENIFSEKNLTLIKQLTNELERIEEVREVKSLSNIDDTIGTDDYFEVRQFLEEIPGSEKALNRLKKQAVQNPLYLNNFISKDGKTTAIIVMAYERPDDDRYRHRLMDKTHEILERYSDRVEKFYLAGKTVTDTTMSLYMEKDVSLLLPLSYILISACLYFFYRNIILTLLGIINISFCLGSVMGFMGVTGITQNSITSIVLPLVMALALCDTVHIYSHMTNAVLLKNRDRKTAISIVLKRVIWPCFMTSLTTIVGFLSLYASKLPPIREFACTASIGIFFEFFYSFFLLPPLILFFEPEKIYRDYHLNNFIGSFLDSISRIVPRFKTSIIVLSSIVLVLSLFFSTRIKIETNIFDFFKQNSVIRNSLVHVESNLSGVESFDISLTSEKEDEFKNPEKLKLIETIQNYTNGIKGVDKTISFIDFLKDMNKSFHNENEKYYTIPDSRQLVSQYLLLYDSDDIDDYINTSYNCARISIRISEHNSSRQFEIFQSLENFISKHETEDIKIQITGRVLQDLNIIQDIFAGQIKSLALAAIIIWGLLFVLFRSFKMGFISIIPNIFPIIINFGVMGALGIPLNTATALIAAVAIGIAVDDTIHFLTEFKNSRGKGNELTEVITHVITQKGRAIFSSSFILCIGFGVLTLSSFIPTVHFGLLCSFIMVSAVIADIFLLPAVLLCFEKDIID